MPLLHFMQANKAQTALLHGKKHKKPMDELRNLLIDPATDEKFNRLFRNKLKKNKISVEKRSSRDYYILTNGKAALGFDVSAEKVTYAKNKDVSVADRLIERIKRDFEILERLVSFTNGQEFIRYTIMRSEEIGKDMISDEFMGNLRKVVCYTSDNVTSRILDSSYIKKWDVPKEVLLSVADRNMCRLLKKTEYNETVLNTGTGIRCLDFKAEGNDFTAALIMCSDFRDHISHLLGARFLVAVPSKDTLLVLSEVTNNVLEGLGTAIVSEYRWASRPLTTDIFHYSPGGIQIAGHFSEL